MIKKSIIAVVAIVASAAIIFAAAGFAGNNNSSDQQKQLSVSNNSGISDSSPTMISSEKAKIIAQKYIEEPGATAGTPILNKTNGQYVYTVPVIENGKNVGEIDIDAQTGKNLGGAGGAP